MSVDQEGERKLIERIHDIIEKYWKRPSYDDSVIILLKENEYLVVHTDVANFSSDYVEEMGFYNLGWKIAISNLSDIACKGAKPYGMLLAISLPRGFKIEDFESIIRGACDAMKENGAIYLGGDLSSSLELSLAGFSFGFTQRPILRSGAEEGDLIGVTGKFGLNSLAYKALFEGLELPNSLRNKAFSNLFKPKGRIKEALEISPYLSSCMDISDGLAISLNQLSNANNLGFEINEIPLDPDFLRFCEENSLDPLALALYQEGEEYELLFTFNRRNLDNIKRTLENLQCDFKVIGKVMKGKGVYYRDGKRNLEILEIGWEHFKYWKKQ